MTATASPSAAASASHPISMMQKVIYAALLICLALLSGPGYARAGGHPVLVPAPEGDDEQEIMAIATISDINNLLNTVSLYVLLEIDVSTGVVFRDKYLIPFGNYLDYQVVGAGKTAYVYPSKIASFIAEKINTGTPPEGISRLVINAFQEGTFSVDVEGDAEVKEGAKLRVGAYLVAGYEVYQRPNGDLVSHFEISQSKFYFSGHYNPNKTGTNVVDFLAEFNPVPEDVQHHIDYLRVAHNGHIDTLQHVGDSVPGRTVPFERLQVTVGNVAKTGINATFGQLRNPFGSWSDFSSYRNLSSTKNNLLVNGFGLKKIDLGFQLDRQVGAFHATMALLSGHKGRTYAIPREFDGPLLDVVLRGTYQRRGLRVGGTAYLGGFNVRKTALGVDASLEANKFLLGAELVYQRNMDFGMETRTDLPVQTASSLSGYVQFDYAVRTRLHVYGLYDAWAIYLDGELLRHPVLHIAHGMRYYLTQNVRWTPLEFALLTHQGFDRSRSAIASRIEVTF